MNKQRRNQLNKVAHLLEHTEDNYQDVGLKECIRIIQILKNEEEEYYDNAPENLQYSMRYESSQDAIAAMDEAIEILVGAQQITDNEMRAIQIEEAIIYLEEAQNV